MSRLIITLSHIITCPLQSQTLNWTKTRNLQTHLGSQKRQKDADLPRRARARQVDADGHGTRESTGVREQGSFDHG
jgi:hypothetical protein